MAEAFLWAALLISSASLVFAGIAFRQVMRTSKSVDGFLVRADAFLDRFKKQAKDVFTPAFMGDTISHALTKGLKNGDGSDVSMAQYVNGYVMTFGPPIYQDIKKEIPKYIPLFLNPPESPSPPGAPPNKGSQLAEARWGSGGLTAASKVGKAAQKLPFGQKIAGYVENARAVVELGGAIKELKNEIFPGKGGPNGEEAPAAAQGDTGGAMTDWGPPV